MGFLHEQVSHIGTSLRNSEQPGLVVDHFEKLFRGHLLGSCQIWSQAGVQIARAGAHHQSRRRSEAHAGVNALAVAHGGHACAVAQMSEDDATGGCRRIAQTREFFHQIGVGQTVETVPLHSLRVIAAWDGSSLATRGMVR